MRRARRPSDLLGLCVIAVLSAASCGDDAGGTAENSSGGSGATGGGGGGTGGGSGTSGGGDASITLDSGTCSSGSPCGDAGVCVGGVCCDAKDACGDACCKAGELCSFEKCVIPGAPCTESADCAPDEYCELALGSGADAGPASDSGSCTGGFVLADGRCLPRPPDCTGAEMTFPDCLPKCELPPSTTPFDPVVTYAWGGVTSPPYSSDVMMTPIVVQLDDDNCDGKITERDIPEIVFNTFTSGAYTQVGTLHAISIVNGQVVEKWSVPGVVSSSSELAGGNIDGAPGNEIVGCASGTVVAYTGGGQPLWTSPSIGCRAPALADLEGDGTVEVVVEGGILNGVQRRGGRHGPDPRAAELDRARAEQLPPEQAAGQ